MNPKIIIHGGAGRQEGNFNRVIEIQESLKNILKQSKEVLLDTNAREAAIFAVKLLEDNQLFNAGTGSKLQSDGKARMSASIIDSISNVFSAVINIEKIRNPIYVASLLKDKKNTILAGEQATNFAIESGFKLYDVITDQRKDEFKRNIMGKTGTVGAVAIDNNGDIAAATSTGGIGGEIAGRVSDCSSVAGNYANKFAGVSCTGIGEHIINFSVASKIISKIEENLKLKDVINNIIKEAEKLQYKFGLIAIDYKGNIVVDKTTELIYYALDNGDNIEIFDY